MANKIEEILGTAASIAKGMGITFKEMMGPTVTDDYPDAPPTFLDDKQFPALWRGPERVFIFVPEEFRKDALSRLPPDSSYLLAESAGKYIFVNQPLRPDLPVLATVLKRHPME